MGSREVLLTQFQLVIAGGMSHIADAVVGGCTSVCDRSPASTTIVVDENWPNSRFCGNKPRIQHVKPVGGVLIPVKRHFWRKLDWHKSKTREATRSVLKFFTFDKRDYCITN